MKTFLRSFVTGLACLVVLAGPRALGVDTITNVWQADSGNYSGNYTNTAHWNLGVVPVSTTIVSFANSQSPAYTVTFTSSLTNDALQVANDEILFELNGNTWRSSPSNPAYADGVANNTWFSWAAGQTSTVTFSSSVPGAIVDLRGNFYLGAGLGSTININSNVTVRTPFALHNNGKITIDGGKIEGGTTEGGRVLVQNGGTISGGVTISDVTFGLDGQWTLSNSTIRATDLSVGRGRLGTLSAYTGSTVSTPGTLKLSTVGRYVTSPYIGQLLVDSSSLDANEFTIGEAADPTATCLATIQNGSTAVITNRLTVYAGTYTTGGQTYTNTLVLNNSTITFGSGGTPGVLTNLGVIRAAGTIRGAGAGKLLVRNEKFLEVGNSIGTLVLSNANLDLTSSSTTTWEFDPSTPGSADLIDITAGVATLSGTNFFTNTTSTLTFGKWDFLRADAITNNATFDNLTNIVNSLTNTLPAGLFANYTYGVVDLPGGGQALELSINMVPEPSTVLLLLGGGLVLWRCRRRK
jgi:hypothetical protein